MKIGFYINSAKKKERNNINKWNIKQKSENIKSIILLRRCRLHYRVFSHLINQIYEEKEEYK
jgi:hypothetical protein